MVDRRVATLRDDGRAEFSEHGMDMLRSCYRAARPWPHLVLTDLLAPDLVRTAYGQEKARMVEVEAHRNRRQAKSETNTGFGSAAAEILDQLQSPTMVRLLAGLTGIEDLRPDPTHHWAGLHVNGPGSFHALHRDFARHPVDGSWHRVNVLVYLNPFWSYQYGGRLELWREGGREPEAVVEPVAPNVVIFEPTFETIHGLPDPITCPPGEARLSLSAYYYSDHPPAGHRFEPLLRRPRRPQDPWRQGFATWPEVVHGIQHRTPEPLRRMRRRLLTRGGPVSVM